MSGQPNKQIEAIEQMVWAGGFCAEFASQRESWRDTNGAYKPSGESCCAAGDLALRLLREALADDCADYAPLRDWAQKD